MKESTYIKSAEKTAMRLREAKDRGELVIELRSECLKIDTVVRVMEWRILNDESYGRPRKRPKITTPGGVS